MRVYIWCLASAAALLLSVRVFAQQPKPENKPDLLARLSYNVPTSLVDGICLSVYRDGAFRMVRSTSDGQIRRLQGKMPEQDLRQLKAYLEAPEFRALSGNHGGLILQESESFGAEIPQEQPKPGDTLIQHGSSIPRRLQWLTADGENPFPAPVSKVVDWLKHFEPRNAKDFEYAEYPEVCPSRELRLVKPVIAESEKR
jgi:hypothetical protein